ncbi:hypothetical protein P025_gp49 [Pelagibacter phage HTVC025P]|jgi:hypothetical protein|uniref:Uncharacterized protein n=1 Tax=Pelagibacter phage HTVC025P TaxID=2259657 RepID=A0A4Y1NU58_9CAUD|nr:hypothetical protein P025_gp49 [Pelagibacter phage HTVC025P]
MINKVIYLRSLFKNTKPDVKLQKLISDAIVKANGIDDADEPLRGTKGSLQDSRKFILDNTEEFLWYAIDYSMADKFNDLFPPE